MIARAVMVGEALSIVNAVEALAHEAARKQLGGRKFLRKHAQSMAER
jgi:hypothetical protein